MCPARRLRLRRPAAAGGGPDGALRAAGDAPGAGPREVLFLCQRHAIESSGPWFPARAALETYADTLSRIKMKYVTSAQDIKLVRRSTHASGARTLLEGRRRGRR